MRDRATANDVPFAPLDKLFEPTVPKGPELPQVDTLDIAQLHPFASYFIRRKVTWVFSLSCISIMTYRPGGFCLANSSSLGRSPIRATIFSRASSSFCFRPQFSL